MSGASASAMLKSICWGAILCSSSIVSGQELPAKPKVILPAKSAYKPHMSFDVASIRESREGSYSYYDNPPLTSYFHAEHVAAVGLVLAAYGIKFYQRLENVPPWMMTTRYTITAKSDDATDEALAKLSDADFRAEKDHMFQGLLMDRFKLKIHPETRMATTYELVATPRAAQLMTPVHGDVSKTISTCSPSHFSKKGLETESTGCPFRVLVGELEQYLGSDIVDDTGMTGEYAFHLMQSPSAWPRQTDEDPYPDTEDAVLEQLGLELKKTKAPVTFWVIDHVERPTPN